VTLRAVGAPLGEHLELAHPERLPARASLQLAARRLVDTAGSHENDVMRLELVALGDRVSYHPEQLVDVEWLGIRVLLGRVDRAAFATIEPPAIATVISAIDLGDDDDALFIGDVHRKCGDAARPDRRMSALDGELDVLRVVIRAANDDEVFDAAADVELALALEAEVASANVGSSRIVGEPRTEHGLGVLDALPVTAADTRPGHPDLADAIRGRALARVGIHDRDRRSLHRAAARHERGALAHSYLAGFESGLVDSQGHRLGRAATARHDQRGLGQTEAREHRATLKARHGKRLGESIDRLEPDRLGAVVRELPARQIECRSLLGRGLAHAQVVREVRPAADRGARCVDRGEPAIRLLEECRRRQSDDRTAAVQRLQHAGHETHVVERRQPRQDAIVRREFECGKHALCIRQHVRVTEQHALRNASRARRVLQHRKRIAADRGPRPPIGRGIFDRVGREPLEQAKLGRLREHHVGEREQRLDREREASTGIGNDRLHARQRALQARRVGRIRRHRHRARVKTSEVTLDEIDAGRKQHQHVRARRAHRAERRPDRACTAIHLAPRARVFGRLAVAKEPVRTYVRAFVGTPTQEVDDGGHDQTAWRLIPISPMLCDAASATRLTIAGVRSA